MREQDLQNLVRIEAARKGILLFRNNTGVAFTANGRPVRYGLANDSTQENKLYKSSDLIGLNQDGRFIAYEIKTKNWVRPINDHELAQERFLQKILQHNGIAKFITRLEDM